MNATFAPDLIIEATQVCDRACQGCYAPNAVSKTDGELLLQKNPELFLSRHALDTALASLSQDVLMIAIRGGEPTKHPKVSELIQAASKYGKIILETHGRWLLDSSGESLLETIKETNSIVKISFDKMHGTSSEELQSMLLQLEPKNIDYLVAITELASADFQTTRQMCAFVPAHKIIFQKKASITNELIKPRLGVIGVNGQFKNSLKHRGDQAEGTLSA